jgi:hypothetical protein
VIFHSGAIITLVQFYSQPLNAKEGSCDLTWENTSILTLGGFHVAGKILLHETERVEFAAPENLTEPPNISKMQNCHC